MQIQHYGRSEAVAVIATIVLATTGCGGKDDLRLTGVRGSVTYQGKPLTHGAVTFTPHEATPGPQAVGPIQSDGTFCMQTAGRDGVAAGGKFLVTVHCRREPTPEEAANLVVPPSLIPKKYEREAESPLRYETTDKEDTGYAIALE